MGLSKKVYSDVKLQARNNSTIVPQKSTIKNIGKCIDNDKRYYEENKENFQGRSQSEEKKIEKRVH